MTNRVKALEENVVKLDEAELKAFATWFATFQDRLWEKQIGRDAKAGKLDFLLEEARIETQEGILRDLVN